MTAVDPDARPVPQPNVTPKRESTPPRVCPYLTTVDGGWRSSTVARENRCGAVAPPAPLAAEKQRRLCLTADYPTCATFEAARAARPVAHDRTPLLPRPLARATPVVLDHGRLSVTVPAFRADRTTVQAVLVVLLGIAFAALVLARLAGGQVPAGAAGSGSPSVSLAPGSSATAVASTDDPSPTSRSNRTPAPTAAASGEPPATAGPAAPASQTYKVKAGDTLVGIAARFGTTPKAIRTLNGLASSSSLRVGQVLKIP